MKIIVLAGGLSTERDVSLSSAAGICRTLVEKGHDAFLLDVFMGLENAPENLEDVFTLPDHGLEIVKNISTEEPDLEAVKASRPDQSDCFFGPNVIELCRLADITFLGLHGGEGENGKLQASFDLLGIKYTGPDSLGCAVAMHKGVAKQIFLESGVDTPGGGTIYKNSEDQSYQSLGLLQSYRRHHSLPSLQKELLPDFPPSQSLYSCSRHLPLHGRNTLTDTLLSRFLSG